MASPRFLRQATCCWLWWEEEWCILVFPQGLRDSQSGSFRAFFLAMLIYTLYFALPFDSTYCQEADRHKVCRSGMYGWCRHPGIWWFFGCFFCMGLSTGNPDRVMLGLCLSFLNLLYAWYQDRLIFVEEFCDYRDYQEQVPFLLPRLWKRR